MVSVVYELQEGLGFAQAIFPVVGFAARMSNGNYEKLLVSFDIDNGEWKTVR